MSKSFCLMILVLCAGVLANQCPAGTTDNLVKSIKYSYIGSVGTHTCLFDADYDIATGDIFYLGWINPPTYFVSRMDHLGNLVWGNAFNQWAVHFSLEYSPTYEKVYYTSYYSGIFALMQVNSTNGNYLGKYQVPGIYQDDYEYRCRLSKDELSFFCTVGRSGYGQGILRFDQNSSQIQIAYYPSQYSYVNNILAITSNEVLYHLRSSNPTRVHIIKATYNSSSDLLVENYHQSMLGYTNGDDCVISRLDDNNETIWHAYTNSRLIYFQHNFTDFSIIGNKYVSNVNVNSISRLSMNVYDGIVCIAYHQHVIIINATTQVMIQVYNFYTTTFFSFLFKGGYLNILGHNYNRGYHVSHDQILTSHGFDNLPHFSRRSYYSFSSTNSYELSDETLSNYSMTLQSSTEFNVIDASYNLEVHTSDSYIISLRDSLDHNLTVSPGQNLTIDLPCRLDDFNSSFSCQVGDDLPPSWATVDCTNFQISVQQSNTTSNISDSFSIESTYPHGQLVSTFNITLVPCDFLNCESCASGICDICSSGYEWNSGAYSCSLIPLNCSSGYEWNTETLTCELISTDCPPGEEWNNDTLTCVLVENLQYCASRSTGLTYKSTPFTITVQVFVGIGAILGLLSAFLGSTSIQDTWNIVHFMQLVMILPLVAKFMKGKAQEFIVANAFSTLSIYPLPIETIESIPLIRDLSFDQPDEYLRNLGLSSGSTFVNNFILLSILFILAIVHFVFCLLYLWTMNKEGKFSSMVHKVYRFFTFTFYIRVFILIYMFTLLMVVSEIKYYAKNGGDDNFGHQKCGQDMKVKGNYVSLTISCILLILPLLFLLLAFISWIKNNGNTKIDEQCKTREFYSGILSLPKRYLYQIQEGDEDQDPEIVSSMKKVKMARFYYISFLSRRLAVVLIAVLIPDSYFALRASLFLFSQVLYIVYTIIIRSFDEKKDQMVELLNEIAILILMTILTIFNSKSGWTDAVVYTIISIILFQTFILMLIAAIGLMMKLIRFIKELKSKDDNLDPEVANTKKQSNDDSRNGEISYQIDEISSQNLGSFPQNFTCANIRMKTYYDQIDEDKKENFE